MSRRMLLCVVLLAGCAAAEMPAEPPAEAAVCPPPTPAAAAPAPASAGAAEATKASTNYHAVEKTIAPAVTGPFATADYIKAVEGADRLARDALKLLVSEDGHPKPASVENARHKLDDLVTALETVPRESKP